jgi:hypothetical protein
MIWVEGKLILLKRGKTIYIEMGRSAKSKNDKLKHYKKNLKMYQKVYHKLTRK